VHSIFDPSAQGCAQQRSGRSRPEDDGGPANADQAAGDGIAPKDTAKSRQAEGAAPAAEGRPEPESVRGEEKQKEGQKERWEEKQKEPQEEEQEKQTPEQ